MIKPKILFGYKISEKMLKKVAKEKDKNFKDYINGIKSYLYYIELGDIQFFKNKNSWYFGLPFVEKFSTKTAGDFASAKTPSLKYALREISLLSKTLSPDEKALFYCL